MQVPCSTPPESEQLRTLSAPPFSLAADPLVRKKRGRGPPMFDEQREPAPHATPLFPRIRRRSAYFFGILRSV